MNRSLVVVAALCLTSVLAGCSEGASSTGDPEEIVAVDNDLNVSSLHGDYAPSAQGDDAEVVDVAVAPSGKQLSITLNQYGKKTTYPLSRTSSGVYVFTSGDLDGSCDDPGCGYITKISGLVYLKKVGAKQVASAKVNVTHQYDHPEYEGDREGPVAVTYRFAKK